MNSVAFSATSRLSIAVIGAGKIGSTFAYQLARAGHEVTAIARPGSVRLQQLQRDRGVILSTGERADMHVADRLYEQTAYDLVVVTVLAYQVDLLLPVLQRSKAQRVHFMFVTFEPERLMEAIGSNRCTFGMPAVMVTMNSDGKLKPTINRRQKTQHSEQRLVDLFNQAGAPSVLEADMMLWLRCHVPLCIAFESIAVAGQRRGGGATFGEAMVVARGLHSGFAIVKALDHTLYPSAKSFINSLPTFMIAFLMWVFSRVPSMRELLATGLNECRALIDTMMAAADKAKLAAPKDMKAVLAMRPAK